MIVFNRYGRGGVYMLPRQIATTHTKVIYLGLFTSRRKVSYLILSPNFNQSEPMVV